MRFLLTIVVIVAITSGCAATAADPQRHGHPLVRDFQTRIDQYVQVREEAARGIPPLESAQSPEEINAAQKLLATRVRERRAQAKHGDILTPEIRVYFRELIAGPLAGPREEAIRALLREDAPDPDALPLEVNALYPTSQPYSTTPPSVLALLPPLPTGLQYRFVGRDLVLLDQSTNLIVDFMRNALPKRQASLSRGARYAA